MARVALFIARTPRWIVEPMSGSKLKASSRRSQVAKRKPAKKPARKNVTPQAFIAAAHSRIQPVEAAYRWSAYGPVALFVDVDIPIEFGSAQMIVDLTKNQICEMHAVDNSQPQKNQAWRWQNPKYKTAHKRESKRRGWSDEFAWDRVRWVSKSPADIMARMRALLKKAPVET